MITSARVNAPVPFVEIESNLCMKAVLLEITIPI